MVYMYISNVFYVYSPAACLVPGLAMLWRSAEPCMQSASSGGRKHFCGQPVQPQASMT